MQDFDLQKKLCLEKLYKPDKSRKGDVDAPIISLIDYINSLKNYYTTSSCSGRIMLLTESEKKPDVKWLFVSHELVEFEEIIKSLVDLPNDRVWLRQENLILHIACRDLNSANTVLEISRNIGLRRSGIIADSNIIIVEICSTEKMDVPIAESNKLLVDKDYIKLLVDIANKKFSKGREKLLLLESEFRKKLI